MNIQKTCLILSASLVLSACSGGNNATSTPQTELPNNALFLGSSFPVALTVVGLNRSNGAVSIDTSTLTDATTITGGRLAGTVIYQAVENAENKIELTSTSQLNIDDPGTTYAFRFAGSSLTGVAGPAATSLPSNSVNYSGDASVSVNDGNTSLVALNQFTATADFGSGQIDIFLANSAGNSIRIDNATISGSQISGGTFTASGMTTAPNGSGTLNHRGSFFQGNAQEIGGAFSIDETATSSPNTFKAEGIYAGTQ